MELKKIIENTACSFLFTQLETGLKITTMPQLRDGQVGQQMVGALIIVPLYPTTESPFDLQNIF